MRGACGPGQLTRVGRHRRRDQRRLAAPADRHRAPRFAQRLARVAGPERPDLRIEAPGPRRRAVVGTHLFQRGARDVVGDEQVFARLLGRETKARQRSGQARIPLGRPRREGIADARPHARRAMLARHQRHVEREHAAEPRAVLLRAQQRHEAAERMADDHRWHRRRRTGPRPPPRPSPRRPSPAPSSWRASPSRPCRRTTAPPRDGWRRRTAR